VHLNRYVVRQYFTCKHAVSLFAIVTFFFLPTVSHFLRDSAADRAFYLFRYSHPPNTSPLCDPVARRRGGSHVPFNISIDVF
jgi:hypothetical protein